MLLPLPKQFLFARECSNKLVINKFNISTPTKSRKKLRQAIRKYRVFDRIFVMKQLIL